VAQMYPQPMHPNTRSRAERKLYVAFQSQLPDDFVVFHSVCWQVRNTRSGVQDGEADFVVAHPDFGILVVEVKGGRIRYEGHTGKWFSNRTVIKDPFEQGREGKYSLLRKLKELPYWRERRITIGYAAAFPDVSIRSDLRFDAPRELILDASELTNLHTWVVQALRYLRGQTPEDLPLGKRGVEQLISNLSPSWNFPLLLFEDLGVEIAEERRQLAQLTEEQFILLDFLGRHRRVAISGCAGSGKTTLAVEKGRRLAEQGFRVLLTCFNVNLADFLSNGGMLPRNLNVANFHKLAERLARKARLAHAGPRDNQYFDDVLPELMMEAIDRLRTQYDAIIVDEGQDFHDNWWVPLQYLLRDPDQGLFYIFFDDNQNLYRAAQTIPLELAPFPLTRNCRNTQCIHQMVMRFYRSDQIPLVQGPLGRPVEVHTYAYVGGLKRLLQRVVHRLVVEENVHSKDIVILTPKGREHSRMWRVGPIGDFRLTDRRSGGDGHLFCSTVHSFKGLESPVVILAEIEPYADQDLDAILYVGCSRACHHLIVLASARLPEDVKRRLVSIQDHRRSFRSY
jgi:hypothetical protein